ncbi:TetR/AcrR family transcriptional regulator [Nocardia sp. NPDC005366]|uniref:TetR/AcrR family transcriptional regulator n=1 Tax=Nocardia sp. NPDC005366 TaxID=3156878 RepID=UPI0033A37EB9
MVRLSVTREDYFEAALKVLATEGHHALKMGVLCKNLGVTTGSFYNYFGNWNNFTPELLAYWEKAQTFDIVAQSAQPTDPLARVRTMKELATRVPHEAEAAIRAWSYGDPVVAQFQRRVDLERLDALRAVVHELVPDDKQSDSLALMGISLLIGMQSFRSPVDEEEFRAIFDEFEQAIMRHSPHISS